MLPGFDDIGIALNRKPAINSGKLTGNRCAGYKCNAIQLQHPSAEHGMVSSDQGNDAHK
jgi:hypothetical protein